jgi:hypothetical protein
LSPIRFLRSCTLMRVLVIPLCLPSRPRCVSQLGPFARIPLVHVRASCSRRSPAALPAVHHYYKPSGHPVAFDVVTSAYLSPGFSSPGPRGLHQFRYARLLRATAIAPPEPPMGPSPFPIGGAAFVVTRATRLPELLLTRIARRSLPAARRIAPLSQTGFVRRLRIRLSSATRLLSFMVETLAMVGFSPTRLIPASLVMPGQGEELQRSADGRVLGRKPVRKTPVNSGG